jgi:hypothetical protein
MRALNITAFAAALAMTTVSAAQAQTERPGNLPPLAQPPSERSCPPGANETTGSRPLSDQLSESKGVICPPAGIDPGIRAPAVGGGRMPVIPPPGTPGGDPSIQPK